MQGKRRSRGMIAAVAVAAAAGLTATVSAGADTGDGNRSGAATEAVAPQFVQEERAPEGSQDRGKDCPERGGEGDGAAAPESGGTATPTPDV